MMATIYKQIPGAEIEPGWYAVLHTEDRDYPRIADPHLGPYRTKRDALRAARQGGAREIAP